MGGRVVVCMYGGYHKCRLCVGAEGLEEGGR